MEITDKGVLSPSFMDFSLPSDFARSTLLYLDLFGHFYCTKDYRVTRDYFEPFLLLYVCDGKFFFKTKDHDVVAAKENVVLLDCRTPHAYGCLDSGEFLYFHFNGLTADAYIKHIHDKGGILFTDRQAADLRETFLTNITAGQKIFNNYPVISNRIDYILATLASNGDQFNPVEYSIQPAIELIAQNYSRSISVEELAAVCGISSPHFYRTFKNFMDVTPHEYLLMYRLKQAKRLLISTTDSIEEISFRCGFNSHSHFTRAFKKFNRMTPLEFRLAGF